MNKSRTIRLYVELLNGRRGWKSSCRNARNILPEIVCAFLQFQQSIGQLAADLRNLPQEVDFVIDRDRQLL